MLQASAGAAILSLLAEAVTAYPPSLEDVPLPTPTGTVKWLPWRGPKYLGSVSPSTFTWKPSMTGAIWLGTWNSKRWREPLPFPAEGKGRNKDHRQLQPCCGWAAGGRQAEAVQL